MSTELPPDIDPELWFTCVQDSADRDYLYNAKWHTFPGRMPAYCPSRKVSFRVSKAELPDALPTPTRYWVEGFIAGNMPRQPDVDDDQDPQMLQWEQQREQYFESGAWPRRDDV
ncbi:MAG: hypothetical protein WCD35_13115 [Mycobacteriales bacterium]